MGVEGLNDCTRTMGKETLKQGSDSESGRE